MASFRGQHKQDAMENFVQNGINKFAAVYHRYGRLFSNDQEVKRLENQNITHTIWTKAVCHLHVTPAGAARPWKPTPRSSRCTDFVLMFMPEEVWSSVVIESAE